MQEKYFITGIGTDVGKTIVSAILTEKLNADYWKPIQSGDLENSDTLKVKNLVSNSKSVFHPEYYRLTQPLSPHLSAELDGVSIAMEDLRLPSTGNALIVEGAGGLMVPLNKNELVLDLIKHFALSAIIVSKNYLGSINHTLLTISVLKQHGIAITGIVFSGDENKSTEDYILQYTALRYLGRVPFLKNIDPASIKEAGQYLSL